MKVFFSFCSGDVASSQPIVAEKKSNSRVTALNADDRWSVNLLMKGEKFFFFFFLFEQPVSKRQPLETCIAWCGNIESRKTMIFHNKKKKNEFFVFR